MNNREQDNQNVHFFDNTRYIGIAVVRFMEGSTYKRDENRPEHPGGLASATGGLSRAKAADISGIRGALV